MITNLRSKFETDLEIPVHFVHILQTEVLPCATIRQSLTENHQSLAEANRFRVIGVNVVFWSLDYQELENLYENFISLYDGKFIDNTKFVIEDAEDDSFINPDGSDNWIYAKSIQIKLHCKP